MSQDIVNKIISNASQKAVTDAFRRVNMWGANLYTHSWRGVLFEMAQLPGEIAAVTGAIWACVEPVSGVALCAAGLAELGIVSQFEAKSRNGFLEGYAPYQDGIKQVTAFRDNLLGSPSP
jgi:hypothetical protein